MIELQPSARPPHPSSVADFKGCANVARSYFGLSGGPSFVAMVQTADLRQCYDSSHFPGLNQARVGQVLFHALGSFRPQSCVASGFPSPVDHTQIGHHTPCLPPQTPNTSPTRVRIPSSPPASTFRTPDVVCQKPVRFLLQDRGFATA